LVGDFGIKRATRIIHLLVNQIEKFAQRLPVYTANFSIPH
jgi:hypothetical protein